MAAITQRDVENVMRTIFRRCVECTGNVAPSCAGLNCAKGQVCVQIPPSCSACASTQCRANPTIGNSAPSDGPNVGAIAGGVVGGVAAIALLVFVIWKYCLKGKRRPYTEADWREVDVAHHPEKTDTDFASRSSARASTHTVASMASTVLTRASNVIQIAYIPGVTNRSGPGSPDMLIPPVPPIPSMTPSPGARSPYSDSEQHFFVPEFRDSMASGISDVRSSYARTSVAPSLARNSVASTVYRQNAIVSPLPAQTVVRGKAAVVSVKSSGSGSPAESPDSEMPPVPQIDPKHTMKPLRIQMPGMGAGASLSPQSSIRSTATLGKVRALNISKKKSDEGPPSTSSSGHSALTGSTANTMTPLQPSKLESDEPASPGYNLLRDSQLTEIADSPATQSPFSDNSALEPTTRPLMSQRITSTSSGLRAPMSPIVEEGEKRASGGVQRAHSPFEDRNRSHLK